MNASRLLPIAAFFAAATAASPAPDPAPLPGFQKSPFTGEQILTIPLDPGVRIVVNAPAPESFASGKKVKLVFFALPNGNTIEQTLGKTMRPGDDWHFDIQHIAAQTRFLRENPEKNVLHTVQVERNGFIHALVAGTTLENKGYEYFGERAYRKFIAPE